MAEPQPLFDYTGYLPECPTWSEAEQALYWADIMECEIHRYDIRSGEHQVLQFPEEVGCFALREKGGFIVALRSGIWLTDAHGLLRRKVCDNPSNPELARFNDGGTDRDGRFYAGTFWGPGDYNGALLMRVDNDLQPKVIQCDIHGANGLAFSADRRWMYTSDTPNAVIYREGLMPYAEIAVGSKRLVHAVRMAAVLSLGSSAVSALLAFYLTFVGAYSALTPVSMLLYLLLWALAALIEGFWADRY